MARPIKPLFGSRHHRKQPEWHLADPPRAGGRWRIDWPLVLLVVFVFVAGFVWIVPAFEQ